MCFHTVIQALAVLPYGKLGVHWPLDKFSCKSGIDVLLIAQRALCQLSLSTPALQLRHLRQQLGFLCFQAGNLSGSLLSQGLQKQQ